MSERVIPIQHARSGSLTPPQGVAFTADTDLVDQLARPLRDLRISVTDRCNFRCTYCMPRAVFDENYRFLPHAELLSFEEITRLARVFVQLGVQKIRLTGGEPLLRKDLEKLVAMLAQLRTPTGRALDLTLTTNGALLARKAHALAAAGLQRVTVSLDALDDAAFKRMNDADFPVTDVLHGIDAAQAAGLPVKINMVVQRGVNDHEVLPMARHFRASEHVLRFIEFMDVGTTNGWRMDHVVPSREIIERIGAAMPLAPVDANYRGEVAERWRYVDAPHGEIGVISSVTQAFCRDCTRARLSTEGKLFLCLFAQHGYDLRSLVRSAASDDGITRSVAAIWTARSDRYSELRSTAATQLPKVEMSYIGG